MQAVLLVGNLSTEEKHYWPLLSTSHRIYNLKGHIVYTLPLSYNRDKTYIS